MSFPVPPIRGEEVAPYVQGQQGARISRQEGQRLPTPRIYQFVGPTNTFPTTNSTTRVNIGTQDIFWRPGENIRITGEVMAQVSGTAGLSVVVSGLPWSNLNAESPLIRDIAPYASAYAPIITQSHSNGRTIIGGLLSTPADTSSGHTFTFLPASGVTEEAAGTKTLTFKFYRQSGTGTIGVGLAISRFVIEVF